MKLYIKSAVYDKKGEDLKKANLAQKAQMKEDEIRRLVEQGISKSELAGRDITKFRISRNGAEFQLDGIGSPIGYDPTISVWFKPSRLSDLPNDVTEVINKGIENGYYMPVEDINRFNELAEKAKDDVISVVDDLMSKYDADGDVRFRDGLYVESDGVEISFKIVFSRFMGAEVDKYFVYQGHDFYTYIDYKHLRWALEESYDYNKDNISEGFETLAEKISAWIQTIDDVDTDEVADDLEYQLKSFESKYKSRFPGLKISNLEVEPILPRFDNELRSASDERYKFSFDLEAYDGEIDITVEMTLDDLKGGTLEDRLINILKYRKRKYGLR